MGAELTKQEFSFMTTGPNFQFEVPGDFSGAPKLTSPVFLAEGSGARSFYFIPTARDNGLEYDFLFTLPDRTGLPVDVFRRADPPTVWWLRWSLPAGFLYTFLREDDGEEMAPVVAQSVSVVDGPSGAPFLLLDPPLKVAVAASPGFLERASFASSDRLDWGIVVRRPGFVSPGRVMVLSTQEVGDQAVVRGGADGGLDITVIAGHDLDAGLELMDQMLTTLAEAAPVSRL